ncbi:hypothetical protein KFL_011100030 [Klebsormidium nitens]|uniref:Uncharacterized protein n=1 Tax=Klebsormidium nitens TaxID=105231 RepID=A0A1Y1IVK8_KLENI|nr:hypothetical protein KFL_011100030 [Klebsormidium nitens]|eukprot:GAQ92727.1 hypothetical protein KFL_011100030 [Klebsormidium nitens]
MSSRLVSAAASSGSDAGMDEGPSSSQASCDVDTVGDALLQWKMARMTEGGQSLDWGRYHLQVMFVDRYHMVRARLVEGLFTRIASWNGAGLALQPHSSGIDPAEGDSPPSRLLEEAGRLRIGQYIVTEPPTRFQRSDLDMHDMIVAVDIGVRDEIMRMVADESPDEQSTYGHKVRLLMDFANYGSASNLEDELAELMESALPGARSSLEIERPYMREWAAWRSMVAIMVLSCSGLVRFLLDQYPDDLPDYDPVD